MTYDVTYGNMSQEEAERLGLAAHGLEPPPHAPGSTEPWISRLVADLVLATGAGSVLETGGYLGDTSVFLAEALQQLGGGELVVCEIDPDRAHNLVARLRDPLFQRIAYHVYGGDVRNFLRHTDRVFDVAWVDDGHHEKHVREEIDLLYPKMRPGGIIAMHDVCGVCPGNQYPLGRICNEFGGYVLNLPRLGPAGGIGILQIPQ